MEKNTILVAYFSRSGMNYVGGAIKNLPVGNTEAAEKRIQGGTAPMPVFTFLENHDLSGKVLLPFCTHEGSGLGHSEADIRKVAPGAGVSMPRKSLKKETE